VSGAVGDPHEYEPSPADRAALESARLVVVNGLGYDAWAETPVRARTPAPAVVSAATASGAESGDNAHLWYDPSAVVRTGAAISGELRRLLPGAEAYLAERATAWSAEVTPLVDAVQATRGRHAGRTYAATEPVIDPLARGLGLTDVTPAGYASAAARGSEPSPGDLNAFRAALREHRAAVLVYNSQTAGAVPEQLRAAAEEAGVPVVDVTETVAPAQGSFVPWQVDQIQRLDAALGRTSR
jgi:zinc/manganese transport system substrate-binding protein